jgi:hypothetical protein
VPVQAGLDGLVPLVSRNGFPEQAGKFGADNISPALHHLSFALKRALRFNEGTCVMVN